MRNASQGVLACNATWPFRAVGLEYPPPAKDGSGDCAAGAQTRRARSSVVGLAAIALLLAASWASAGEPASGPFSGELEVTLWKGLFQGMAAGERPAHLILHLETRDGRWGPVWGMALGYNNGVHYGVVREGTFVAGGALRLIVGMVIDSDPWTPGGIAAYTIDLRREAGGAFQGTFHGSFKGREVSGEASGRTEPPRPVRVEGFSPVAPDEHPRLLLRKSDLPRLRAKLKTPFGKAYLERARASGDLVNLGLLHQLTGEKAYADRAAETVRGFEGDLARNGFGSGGFGHRLVSVCLAYDLCFDAWPADLKKQVETFLLDIIPRQQKHILIRHANYHPCCNYYGPGRAVPALAALVLWGAKGPPPVKPADPTGQAVTLKPDADYTPPAGVPVVDFEPGATPPKWLDAGPLTFKADRDVLGAVGGCAGVRPEVGTTARFVVISGGRPRMGELAFAPLKEAMVGDKGVVLERLAKTPEDSTTFLYTVLKVNAGQVVGFVRGLPQTKVWLAGTELNEDLYYRLEPGLYPMLAVHATGKSSGVIAPRLVGEDSPDLAARRAVYDLDLAIWKAEHEAWERSGGLDRTRKRFVDVGYQQVMWHYRLGIGDGGFQAETGGYAGIASWYPLVYATAYLKMFGRAVSPYPDIAYLMPRRMMQVLFRPAGTREAQKLNSVVGIDAPWCAAAFPIVPEPYKPALLWAWNHVTGVTDENTQAKALPEKREGGRQGLALAHTFLHYPLDSRPVHPGKVMPLAWEAPTFGFHCFRSGWEGQDEFIAQVFLKAHPVGGWNHPNAGAFRIFGLGHPWVTGPTSRNGVREQESVVLLPQDAINESSCGRLAYRKTAPDGSAVLTIDLGDVYARKSRLYDRNLIRWPERMVPSGITGLRALAFDYSGTSGAPAMMILVDRISGGKKKVWLWQMAKQWMDHITLCDHAFTLDHGDASMTATFVAPKHVHLEAVTERIEVRDARHGYHGDVSRVKATGGDNFFVVLTFQRKDPPRVTVKGNGLDAGVTVGRQTVRFDPGPPARIVLAPGSAGGSGR